VPDRQSVDGAVSGEALELLTRLVRSPSPNPPGDERLVVAAAREYVETIPGIEIADVGVSPERPMLIATLEGNGPGRTLMFGGHIDTVPPAEGWTRDPFGAELVDGRLYGLGSSDMKAGVAGFLVAFKQLANMRDRWSGKLVAHVVPDEEPGGQLGAAILLERGLIRGDAAIVAEPSELAVYRAQKGNLFMAARFTGRSAHGATPELGNNAIRRAARFAVELEEVLLPRIATRHHDLVGAPTINLGTIAGGRRTNMVADECVLTFDRRVVPGESLEAAKAEIEEFIAGRAELTYEHAGAAFETPADHWLVRAAVEAVERVRGRTPAIAGLIGSSDARFYADGAGVPTIILGPGSLSLAHTPNEYVEIEQLTASVDVYTELALLLLT
jgi:acetylornithine deacetylase/succinyl-diaminopimelate desuccinylase family protein